MIIILLIIILYLRKKHKSVFNKILIENIRGKKVAEISEEYFNKEIYEKINNEGNINMEKLLQIKNLSKSFNDNVVLKNINLDVDKKISMVS